MANRSFDGVVGKMRGYLGELKDCEPFCVDGGGNLRRGGAALPEIKGVYCFYEDGKPLYVGRSRNIRKRVLQHRRQSSGHNTAQFAFNIAKIHFSEEFKRKYPNKDIDKFGREKLAKDPDFNAKFAAAKNCVREMSVRFVKIKDPIEQTIFEVYAHIKLETDFNDFETH